MEDAELEDKEAKRRRTTQREQTGEVPGAGSYEIRAGLAPGEPMDSDVNFSQAECRERARALIMGTKPMILVGAPMGQYGGAADHLKFSLQLL